METQTDAAFRRSLDRFWHNYLSVLEKLSIPIKARPWYRKHVEDYISAHQGVKLPAHSAQHIDKYLVAKGRLRNGGSDKLLTPCGYCSAN